MLDVGRLEQRHFHGHADAVVGTEGRTLCLHPFAVHVGLYGIAGEVEADILVLLAHHVHVTLQHDGLSVLHAGRGWLANDDVARFVATGVEVQPPTEVEQEVNHLLLMLRGAWYSVHLSKALEYACGL